MNVAHGDKGMFECLLHGLKTNATCEILLRGRCDCDEECSRQGESGVEC
jgi:hypothetical protein